MNFKVGDTLMMVDHGIHNEYMEDVGYPLKCLDTYNGTKDALIQYKNLTTGIVRTAYKFRFDFYKEISEKDIL